MFRKYTVFAITAILVLMLASPVLAEADYTGVVLSIDTESFQLLVDGTDEYTVIPDDTSILTTINVGDIVTVTGTLEDGIITAGDISIVATYVEVTGTVQAVDGSGIFVLEVSATETYTVHPPEGYAGTLNAGDLVMVVGTLQDGTIQAARVLVHVKVVGTVLPPVTTTFQFQIDGGAEVTVTPYAGFELSTIGDGDILIVSGWQENTTILATEITTLFKGDGEGNKGGHYCENLDDFHPVARKLAEHYGAFYQEVMSWFCVDNFGFGEIKNMFKVNEKLGDSISTWDLLAMKEEMGGWGKVWKSLDLIGSGKESGKPETKVMPETSNKPDQSEKHTGKPEQTKKPEHTGPPDHAKKDKDK